VPLSAFALALGAAFLHASWNVLIAGSRDSESAIAVATLAGVAILAPVALITGGVQSAALPYAGASAVLEVGYLALLARAYQGGQVSVIYPVSRGTAPVLVLAFGAAILGEDATAVQAAGVVAVSTGVFLVGGRGEVGRETLAMREKLVQPPGRDLLFGFSIALTIAAYTLVDAEGVDRAQAPAYLFLVLAPASAIYATVLAARGRGAAMRAELNPRALLTGALIVGAYGSVLAALRLADAAPVAAVRESSVVIAALMAAVFLHERVDGRRGAGAAVVVAGVAAIALG
jgi:drug/metabolite transporter (DMT)-like permease